MNAAPLPYDWVQPVTITPDRYGGLYSGGEWLAFPLDTSKVPEGPFSGDNFAADWWDQLGDVPVGRGATPDQAYDDLVRRLEAIRPARTTEPSELGGTWWWWELRWPTGQVTRVTRSWRGEGRGPRSQADTG